MVEAKQEQLFWSLILKWKINTGRSTDLGICHRLHVVNLLHAAAAGLKISPPKHLSFISPEFQHKVFALLDFWDVLLVIFWLGSSCFKVDPNIERKTKIHFHDSFSLHKSHISKLLIGSIVVCRYGWMVWSLQALHGSGRNKFSSGGFYEHFYDHSIWFQSIQRATIKWIAIDRELRFIMIFTHLYTHTYIHIHIYMH